MKVDVVMWTRNGAGTLEAVLDRINKVIPEECVNQRFIVDDHSIDDTGRIAEKHGWNVSFNEGTGISDGSNTALKNVDSDYFISFEQDLLLACDWWSKIPKHLSGKIATASGMRFSSQPIGVRKLQMYVARKYRGEKKLVAWLRNREAQAFTLGKTLDNTIYQTDVLRSIGGFPNLKTTAGVDTVLAYEFLKAGYDWAVDYNVQSVHLRTGLRDELRHQYSYGTQIKEIHRSIIAETGVKSPISSWGILYRLFTSPFSGIFVALKTREASVVYVHPLIRLYYAKGLLEGV